MEDFIGTIVVFGFFFGIFSLGSYNAFDSTRNIPKQSVVTEIHPDYIELESLHRIEFDKKYSIGDTIKFY